MSTFSQWWKSHSAKPQPKQVTWVCGNARVLVDDVVESTIEALDTRPWSVNRVLIGETTEDEMWAMTQMVPLETEDQVIVVLNGERLQHPERALRILENKRRNPRTYLIIVSSQYSAPKVKDEETGRRHDPEWVAKLKKSGKVVECRPFSKTSAAVAVNWIMSRGGLPRAAATKLLVRANGELRVIRDACVKLSVVQGGVTSAHVEAIIPLIPDETFVDALMLRDKKTALAALERLGDAEREKALYDLTEQLTFVGRIHDMLAERISEANIRAMAADANRAHLVGPALRVQQFYKPKRRMEIKRLLEEALRAYDAGARVGVLESIVAIW